MKECCSGVENQRSMIPIYFSDQNFCSKYPVLFMIRICYMAARVHLCPLSYGNGQPELWKPKQINKIWSGANLNAALVNRVKPPIRHTNWLRLTCNSYLRNMTGLDWCHKKSFNRGKCSFAAGVRFLFNVIICTWLLQDWGDNCIWPILWGVMIENVRVCICL